MVSPARDWARSPSWWALLLSLRQATYLPNSPGRKQISFLEVFILCVYVFKFFPQNLVKSQTETKQ